MWKQNTPVANQPSHIGWQVEQLNILFCVKIPTSQAAAERAWSIYDFILIKRRNRLDPGKVTKLVQLYMDAGLAERKVNLIDIMMGLAVDDDNESTNTDNHDE